MTQPDAWNAEIDVDDTMTAFYTGARELDGAEYEQAAALHRADTERVLEHQDREAEYAAWAKANPEAHAERIAEREAEAGAW